MLDDLNDRPGGSVERWCGSAIQFRRTTVSKHPCLPKKSTIRFRRKTGPQCRCGLVARKNQLECLYNF